MVAQTPTRQRLIDAGMQLFADQGYGATSVADIETAVGLQPRRGGLYKHFANKQALLEAAVREHLDDASAAIRTLDAIDAAAVASDPETLRAVVVDLGRLFLAVMDRMETLTRVLEHDARRLPELTATVKDEVVDLSYRAAARAIASAAPEVDDPDAVAVIALGSLVAARRTTWTFGSAPLSIADDRLLRVWAQTSIAAAGLT
ncbi:MAG: TetR/AcrR family transcriptional regulator [Acidimicrobiia bacterium]|nr:TetR/AcrR family transcriptional regulator [Acidimicrobiia bacterium]